MPDSCHECCYLLLQQLHLLCMTLLHPLHVLHELLIC